MKITSIKLSRFCQFRELTIETPADIMLFGNNGAGKTTLLNAIRWAFFGYCPLTDRRGAGSRSLIWYGAKESQIDIGVDLDGEVYTLAASIFDTKGNEFYLLNSDGEIVANDRKAFWEMAGTPLTHAQICANPSEYIDSKDLTDALAQMLSSDISPDDFAEFLSVNGGWLTKYAKEKDVTIDSITALSEIGDIAYKERTTVKQWLKQTDVDLEGLNDISVAHDARGQVLAPQDIPKVQDGIDTLLGKRDALLVELGASKTSAQRAEQAPVSKTELQNLKKEQGTLSKKVDTTSAALKEAEEKEREYSRAHADWADKSHKAMQRRDKLKSQDKGVCPTCGQSVDVTDLLEEAENECRAISKEHDAALVKIGPAKKAATKLRDELSAMQAQMRNIAATIAQADAYEPPEPARPVQVIQGEIDGLDMRIARAKSILELLEKHKQREDLQRSKANYESLIENLNWAVEQFKKGVALNRLVGDKLVTFTNKCNENGGLLDAGYEMFARVDGKEIELLMKGPDDLDPFPLRLHSRGRQMLAAVAIAEAFSDTGAVILLDDCNHLDATLRKNTLFRLSDRTGSSVWCATAWQSGEFDQDALSEALAPAIPIWVPPLGSVRK